MDPRSPEITDFDKNDIFHDKDLCKSLSELAEKSEHGLVVSLESGWGNGKTTFVNRWRDYLKSGEWHKEGAPDFDDPIKVVYIDAFKKDYLEDPFESIFKAVLKIVPEDQPGGITTIKGDLKKAGKGILRGGISLALKRIPVCGPEIAIIADDIINGIIERHLDNVETDPVVKFKESLKSAISDIRKETGMPLIIILDELDRCRPDYAVKMLESIKHLFDDDNIFFLLAINKEQLEGAIKGVYFTDANSATVYLNKFIDITCLLPNRDTTIRGKAGYVENILRSDIWPGARFDSSDTIVTMIKELIIFQKFNLREIYKYLQQLSLFGNEMRMTSNNACYFALIVVHIKMCNDELFQEILFSDNVLILDKIKKYMLDINKDATSVYYRTMSAILTEDEFNTAKNIYRTIRDMCKEIAYLQKN